MNTKIDLTLNYIVANLTDNEDEAVRSALGDNDDSSDMIDNLANGEKVRVRLTAEQFATLVLNRRNKKVEDTLKWSKAEIVSAPAVDFDFAK